MALVLALVALVPNGVILGTGGHALGRFPVRRSWVRWLAAAVAEEEQELQTAIHPQRGTPRDAAVAGLSLLFVVGGSVMAERAASTLGGSYGVPQIVVGGLVLAAVTSLPNAVAAIYLPARGRGAAVLSAALNSNAVNVVVGLLVPGTIIGLGAPSSPVTFTAAWFVGLTIVVLVLAYGDRGVRRDAGALVVASYLVFVGAPLATVRDPSQLRRARGVLVANRLAAVLSVPAEANRE